MTQADDALKWFQWLIEMNDDIYFTDPHKCPKDEFEDSRGQIDTITRALKLLGKVEGIDDLNVIAEKLQSASDKGAHTVLTLHETRVLLRAAKALLGRDDAVK